MQWSTSHQKRGRNLKRLLDNPELADLPDKEAEYFLKWTEYFQRKGIASIPLADFCVSAGDEIDSYFKELHIAKGNKLSSMSREADTYHSVMSEAAKKGWVPEEYPVPNLPEYDVLAVPVNKMAL